MTMQGPVPFTPEEEAAADAEELIAAKQIKIESLRSSYVSEVYSDIQHAGQTWRADPVSRGLLAQVLAVGSVPLDMYWRDSAGTAHPVTYADLQSFAFAILTRGLAADANLITKTDAVDAATTAAEIDAIQW